MKKTELIAKLNAIEGDPMVLIPSVDFEAMSDFISFKVGKSAAGSLLDGEEYKEFPLTQS